MKKRIVSSNVIKKEFLTDHLKVPMDVCEGTFRITMLGNREICVENYKGILAFSPEEICISGKGCILCIRGCGLYIEYYTMEDMKIRGKIGEVTFR